MKNVKPLNQQQIDIEMIHTYLEQSRTAVYCAISLVLFLALSFYQLAPTNQVLLWAASVLAIDAIIVFTSLQFKPTVSLHQAIYFKQRQQILHILAGLAWGSAFFLLLDYKHPQLVDFRLAAIVGVVIAFSASTMSASLRGLIGFAGALSLMTLIYFLLNINIFKWWIFALSGLNLSCLFFGWVTSRRIVKQVEYRLMNDDYISELEKLNLTIESTMQNLQFNNNALINMQKKLERLATHDDLTSLYNRRFIVARLAEKLPEVLRYKLDYSVVAVDIDHFKKVNDQFGHAAGDEVLRRFAQTLTNELRQNDVLARFGGEEFLLLLPMTSSIDAKPLIERLRDIIEQQSYVFAGNTLNVTASFGIAEYRKNDTVELLLERADQALYQAKMGGRNRVSLSQVTH
jgi:diguanylate cyclase (GGDEF)-like protein